MYTTSISSRSALLGAVALLAALAGCNRQDDTRTPGQKLDGAIAETKQSSEEAKAKVNQAVADASAAVSDATIITKINASLVTDDKLKAGHIDVKSTDGRVTLTGTAPDSESQSRATSLALAVNGVRSVDNQLVVAPKG
ncbi:BON domain-containing protein [Burkholderiaceae bacterium UC74_6]